jgi:hypothetical protein
MQKMRFKEAGYITRILIVKIIIKKSIYIVVVCLPIPNVFLKDGSSITGM